MPRYASSCPNTVADRRQAIPITGTVFFVDHNWSDHWSSSAVFRHIDNVEGQAANAYKTGNALGNLLYTPVPGVMMSGEFTVGQHGMFRTRRGRGPNPVLVQIQLLSQGGRIAMA
jgi:hypothetical protein